MCLDYDPDSHAESLGLTIIEEAELPTKWRGAYSHQRQTIYLVKGMSNRERRCTLAHEVQHAIAGDVASDDPYISLRMEKLASRRAANCLIDLMEYFAATSNRGWVSTNIAHELNVTMRTLKDWRRVSSLHAVRNFELDRYLILPAPRRVQRCSASLAHECS